MKVLTYNVAGIPFVHPRVAARLRRTAARLRSSDYDVVAVQELWVGWLGWLFLRASAMAHHVRFAVGRLAGAGLATLSRHPIVHVERRPFAAQTPLSLRLDGEGISLKGVLLTRLATPSGELDVYNTHLTSFYDHERYEDTRARQIEELADFMTERSAGRSAILMGDLNLGPEEPTYRRLIERLRLFDTGKAQDATTFQGRRIDYILLPETAQGSVRFALPSGFGGSDHLPLEAEFGPALPALRAL